ncbi:MAG: T9SS type A sorting domain-containing protein [Bacteroidetes bacterium]|nr:T9SS type A sorting domain-containing protein [Bacteroidota bacterium]
MKKCFTFSMVVLLVSFPEILTPTFGQWTKHIIDDNLPLATVVSVADIDGDDDMDVLATAWQAGDVVWYENNHSTWTKHFIDANLAGAATVDATDIDGDDTLDVVATAYYANDVVWYENNHPTWTKYTIDANLHNVAHMIVADIDGDDTLDVVAAGWDVGGDVVWYENNHPTWTKHSIASNWGFVPAISVGDIDGDENLDVLATGDQADKVVWFRNENAGLSWTEYTIDDNLDGAWVPYIADVDGDDTLDVVVTGENANDVVWYENNHPTWTKHTIDANLPKAKCIGVADIDGDEKPDVVAVGYTQNGKVVWYKNNHPDPWDKIVIDTSINGPNYPLIADIDGDNTSDVVVAVENAGMVVWYKNPHSIVAQVNTLEVYPRYISPQAGDTLKIIAHVSNPENHQATVHTFIQGENSALKDSVQLFDDGLHDDGIASDNIYGGIKLVDDLDEDYFDISIRTTDSDESVTTYFNEGIFTTIGPLSVDHYEIVFQEQDAAQLDYFKLKVFLKNNGANAPAIEVRADISTTDTNIGIMTGRSLHFNNIDPGQIKFNDSEFRVYTKNDPDSVKIDVSIFSKNILYWSDTITVNLVPVGVTSSIPTECELFQCFPNPFSNTTNISYSIASSGFVSLTVYDMFGREIQTLVNESQNPGKHSVEFDTGQLSSGIYFYRLQVGPDFLKTRKMLYSR